ncbi:MAG TPA: aminomethyltransferase family protein [Candidatus Binatia bacterium]|nr:aminomethyltransferase family protein [Candidatus Binatia bacterium]
MPRALALISVHRQEGASMGEAFGWDVPLHYGSAVAEHAAVREGLGVVDRSLLGKAMVTGRDRAAFLQGMLSNDVKALAPGQGCAAAFLDAHGKVMALLDVYAAEDRLLLVLPPSLTEKTLQLLDRYLISEKAYFETADEAWAVLTVLGPRAGAAVAAALDRPVALSDHEHVEGAIGEAPVRVIESGLPGVPGYACWTAAEHGPTLWRALREAGARPVGSAAYEILRVEAGVPSYGVDVDETVILPELRREDLISYTKGCYIGQEVVARVKYRGHVNRALCGLVLGGQRVPQPGARVMAGGKDVGRVTSAVRSPAIGAPIALGYVRREHLEPGSAVEIADGDATTPARVAALPFADGSAGSA